VITQSGRELQAIAYGHISTSPKKTPATRLAEIARDLSEIIQHYHPEEASIEELFFFKNHTTVIPVAQARGAILLTLEQHSLSTYEYTPLQVKQALTGYGRADKTQVQLMVKSLFKLAEVPRPDDTADALAIALCHLNSRKMQTARDLK
jgi:crossover junction endodeoxyribonuclease RuvC